MKLTVAVLLTLAALSWADTSYQNFHTYQDHQGQQEVSNYYQHQPSHRRAGKGLSGIIERLLYPVRRQDGGIAGGGVVSVLVFATVAVVGAVVAVGYVASTFNNSGRGLDTDEWEVDHSVWMDQLQKDFEDSWSN